MVSWIVRNFYLTFIPWKIFYIKIATKIKVWECINNLNGDRFMYVGNDRFILVGKINWDEWNQN